MKRANTEGWTKLRKQADSKSIEKAQQKTADAAAATAAIAERIRQKLLKRIEKEIDALPEYIGSQTQQAVIDNEYDGEKSKRLKKIKEARKEYRLRDLTAAYKDLTAGMENTNTDTEPVQIIW